MIRCLGRIKKRIAHALKRQDRPRKALLAKGIEWEYKVVQMIAQAPPNPNDASKKLGGSLSVETLRNQFPEYYKGQNGRQQINDFLNVLGSDRWELIAIQQIAEMPLMVFKRPKSMQKSSSTAKSIEGLESKHGERQQ